MNKEQIYSNMSILTQQLISNGMQPEAAAEKAEIVIKKVMQASERLATETQTT